MTHGSLFSGIGGFDLVAERMGWENIFHCEIDKFCNKVLKHHWPNTISYEDITNTDFTIHRGAIDVLSGGFPCQDASLAKQMGGGQKGLEGDRTGLWTHMVRAIEEIQPKYVVAENVSNILKTNDGRDFRTIITNLGSMGYNAEWRVCRASEVGAPHHRARCYMVAYSDSIRLQPNESFFSLLHKEIPQERRFIDGTTASVGIQWGREPSISFMDDGLSARLDGITLHKFRAQTIKAGGNSVVIPLVHSIFKAIENHNL